MQKVTFFPPPGGRGGPLQDSAATTEPESPVPTKGKEVTVVQPVRARGEPRPTHVTGRDPERP
jgi:hypothetical protein